MPPTPKVPTALAFQSDYSVHLCSVIHSERRDDCAEQIRVVAVPDEASSFEEGLRLADLLTRYA